METETVANDNEIGEREVWANGLMKRDSSRKQIVAFTI